MSKVRDKKRAKGRAHTAQVKARNRAAGVGMSYSFIEKCMRRGKLDRDEILRLAEQEAQKKAKSHHKSDDPRFGAGTKAVQQVQSTLNRMMSGAKGVRVEAELVEMVGDRARSVPGTKFEVGDPNVKMPAASEPKVKTFSQAQGAFDETKTFAKDFVEEHQGTFDELAKNDGPVHPSNEQWNEVLDEARARKKGVAKIAERHGLKLLKEDVSKDALRDRKSWVVA
jgi:hypothetical protein